MVDINPNGATDNMGRIVDPHTGRPLRNRRDRSSSKPFYGQDGKPNRKPQARLEARIREYEDALKRGTLHDIHRPGSLQQ